MLRCSRYVLQSSNAISRIWRRTLWSAMSAQDSPALQSGNGLRRRESHGGRAPKRQRTKKEKPIKEGSNLEVLLADIYALLTTQTLKGSPQSPGVEPADSSVVRKLLWEELPTPFSELDVNVIEISSTGDGLAMSPSSSQIYVVPFTAPGDTVRVKVIKHFKEQHYSLADFLHVIHSSPLRDDSRINCKYFSKCSGCQFQMLDYPTQLEHKRTIVERAYKNFSQLSPNLIPAIGNTVGSPLTYGYRTKLTPHFDGPPGSRSRINKKNRMKPTFETVPEIGFMQKGQPKTLDIEDCPIGTDAVRMGMKSERSRVAAEIEKYQRGATILLRESTSRIPKSDSNDGTSLGKSSNIIQTDYETYSDLKTCITDNNATSTEYVGSYIFMNPAGAFFQNNNSILPTFTEYIRKQVLPTKAKHNSADQEPKIKYLIDAYCGSGLFTITLSSLFTASIGIDISGASIDYARKNAGLNHIPSSQASFIAADAPELFKSVPYPADETAVIIDPPRKGCDDSFLNQLLKFAPKRVVYVSCNVHTQARDVGVLVRGKHDLTYKIESLIGFDFFPQTSHVEGVAVLSRVDAAALSPNHLSGA